jgi:N-acetylmuramoyl-L-alanine amidase
VTLAVALAVAYILLGAPAGAAGQPTSSGQPVDAARFQHGSCVSFAPTGAIRLHRTVYLDDGHGGPDPGAIGTTANGTAVEEALLTLRVALDALPLLRNAGFRVVLSRTGPNAVARPAPGDLSGRLFTAKGVHRDLVARNNCANISRADVLIGVFFDASASGHASGSLTLYDPARPFWRASLRLAELVQRDVRAALDTRRFTVADDGVRSDEAYGSAVSSADRAYGHLVLLGPAKRGYLRHPSVMPGALIEPLFLTNPVDASRAASGRGQGAIATGLASAVAQYFGASLR